MTKTSRKTHVAKDSRFKGMALICDAFCFHKTEIIRFGPNSGGNFLTQKTLILYDEFEYFF